MPTPYDPAYIPGLNPVQPTGGLDPAYPMGGASPVAQSFTPGAGGIMPGTPGSMGLIPPMPQMAMPGLSPYGPAIPGTQSMMPAPVGGQWNQLAQQMAGPMFMPPSPSKGIPYPNPVMPGGGPIATVAAPKPSVPVTMPVTSPVQIPAGTPRLSGGASYGGGSGLGMGSRTIGMYATSPIITGNSIFGVDGSPYGGGGGAFPSISGRLTTEMV